MVINIDLPVAESCMHFNHWEKALIDECVATLTGEVEVVINFTLLTKIIFLRWN